MAGFELRRLGSVGEMRREWRIGRYLPLYLAGIAGGVALGMGMTFYNASSHDTETHITAGAPTVSEAPAFQLPAVSDAPLNVSPSLPEEFTRLFVAPPIEAPAAPAVPAAPEAPVTPVLKTAAPAAPQAAQPAAPVAPVQPAAAPANPPAQAAAPVDAGKPNFYVPAVAGGGASTLEQALFDGINGERANAGLPAYSYDAGLTTIARTRSQQMADHGYFAHKDPFGYTMYTELLAYFGYTSYAWAGENLAMNNYAASESAARAVISLMNSPTHRANLLANDFFRIGIGEVTTADGRHIFSMIFIG